MRAAGAPGPGVDTLPPFAEANYGYNRSCAMGSVISHYDGRIKNPGQLPPQMDNVWSTGDYNTRKPAGANLNCNGGVASGNSHHSDTCSGILLIEYQGSCADTGLYPRNPVTGIGSAG